MAGIKISALPPATSALITDIVPAVQGGVTYSETLGQILALAGPAGANWVVATTATQLLVNTGYISNSSSLVTFTLPTTAAVGSSFSVVGNGSGGWKIAQNALQNIQIGNVSSTVGTGGSVASTNRYDSVNLVCTVANTTWVTWGGPQSSGLTIV